ncbi:MAG: FkbM family methyltransferase [Myxococcales bacterium]|nr:FkbM family methyltransferase [Myxococcota bacterium]MDW8280158.1 FkbM family methyltransferase [Myxococcales bacterium]
MSTPEIGLFPLRGGLQVVAPRSLDLITPYVLEEQQDWFEDEIRFIRRLVRPGDRVIDVGASYGVYTLTMARLVGPAGLVAAFEPTRATMECLRQSVVRNGLENIRLYEAALSNREGEGELCVGVHSELNSLASLGAAPGPREIVQLRSLDRCAQEEGLRGIDFVKLDAEGEEARIIEGGQAFFQDESPLVMFEFKQGEAVNLHLIETFHALKYAVYRLVPGLGVLVPFSLQAEPDPFLLNLFACKPDRAQRLAAQGLLHDGSQVEPAPPCDPALWQLLLADRPFFREVRAPREAPSSRTPVASEGRYRTALSEFARAHAGTGLSAGARHRALEAAFEGLRRAVEERTTLARLQSLARVAWEVGHRLLSVRVLGQIAQRIRSGEPASFGEEPFLPVGERFDHMEPRGSASTFVLCSALEQREKLRAFSSYYTGQSGLSDLQHIWELGQGGLVDEEVGRRLQLIRRRHRLT